MYPAEPSVSLRDHAHADTFEPAFPGWYRVLLCNGSNYGLRYNILCEIERGNHGGPGGWSRRRGAVARFRAAAAFPVSRLRDPHRRSTSSSYADSATYFHSPPAERAPIRAA